MIVRVKKIDVEFIDADSGQSIGHSKVPLGDLPKSFALNTTLTIKDDEYTLVSADPLHAEDFQRTGRLVLTLRQIRRIDPNRVLFTIPTLSDDTFPLTDRRVGPDEDYLSLHEDAWRQIELVSGTHLGLIEEELNDIRRVIENDSVPGSITGFRSLHVRKSIISPISSAIAPSELRAALPRMTQRRGIVDEASRQVIDGGFAYVGPHSSVYGIEREGHIAIVGLEDDPRRRRLTVEFADFMANHNLLLVDWCRTERLDGT
jgi:hypothetical protein